MKQFRRWSFKALMAGSLLLLLLLIVFWMRGYWVTDDFDFRHSTSARNPQMFDDRTVRDVDLDNSKGGIGLYILSQREIVDYIAEPPEALVPGQPSLPPKNGFTHTSLTPAFYPNNFENEPGERSIHWGGFTLGKFTPVPSTSFTQIPGPQPWRQVIYDNLYHVVVPIWFVTLPASIFPFWFVWTRWRRQLRKPGYCTTCGYDLRATPNLCPECGMVPIKPQ